MPQANWYRKAESEVLAAHDSTLESGISPSEAERRRKIYGENTIREGKRRSPFRILLSQFTDFLILVLIAAAVIAGFLGEPQDTIAIIAIIVLNAALGFSQEYRAEKAMEALKALASPHARVRRSGGIHTVAAYELVPGDIVLLEAGNLIPADVRILQAFQFKVDESALTGESLSVDKMTPALDRDDLAVADQKNMAFKGTLVTAGRATGLVVSTGMATELGRIAQLLREEVEVKTPLQNRLGRFARGMAFFVVLLCAVIFAIGIFRGQEPVLTFLTALSLAVAGIPEALPAVVTVALALGARTMSRRQALIRKLPAVEALGSVTWVCSDKTGTLTENRMRAQSFWLDGQFHSQPRADWNVMNRILALSNDVNRSPSGDLQGDPTEIALVEAAWEVGYEKEKLEKEFPRVAEVPFSSERGRMSTVHSDLDGTAWVFVKGAPEKVLPLCQTAPEVDGAIEQMARRGFRILAMAYRKVSGPATRLAIDEIEKDLSFAGLIGLMDPPRAGVREAIAACQSAGIQVSMITGDHPFTAAAIGTELGILNSRQTETITGVELEKISDEELKSRAPRTAIYARVAPEQKIRIVKALQEEGQVVAMTGDGVNDAPALKRADVGVSMGKGGTDVAREASHVILLDDNFTTIVTAILEGRRIYDNIRKFVRFALSGNSGEIWTLFAAPFLGLPTPLLPIHILWVNLVTDGLPGLALAVEPEEPAIMKRRPRAPNESIFAHGLWQHSVWVGLLTAALTLGTMAWAYWTEHAHWQSMAFTVLTFTQMGHVMAIRSERESLWRLGLRSNLPLLGAVFLTFVLQLCTLYVPWLNPIFKTEPLFWDELLICTGVSSVVFFAVEVEKWIGRRNQETSQ
jgi:Ca2+-transporting ATPase